MKLKIISSIALPIVILLLINHYDNATFLKIIPAIISSVFFIFFLKAHMNNKQLILHYTQRFYKKELSEEEVKYISKGDLYWVYVTFLNTLIQVVLVFGDNNILWVFYTSVGWYIFLFIALIIQVLYGKLYVEKI